MVSVPYIALPARGMLTRSNYYRNTTHHSEIAVEKKAIGHCCVSIMSRMLILKLI